MTTHNSVSRFRDRLVRLACAAVFAFTFTFTLGAAEAAKKSFDLPAGDAATTLKVFTQQSGEQIVYPVEQMRGVKTNAVKGEFATRDALDRMLDKTGLAVVQDEKTGALAIRRDSDPNAPRVALEKNNDRPEQSKVEEGKLVLEKVEVTGSRIRTLVGEQTALPVFTLTQVELEQRGVNRLSDLRWAIPQLAPAQGYNDNLQNSGTSRAQTVGSSFNLRGLGGNTTLVLVDGRRIPHTGQEAPGGAGGREDYNIDGIPVAAIERIEVLPQGASAIYGADAIAGVINIILKKHFTGNEVRLGYDNTFSKDAAQKSVSVTTGARRGKFQIFASVSWEENNALRNTDRWFSSTFDRTQFGGTFNTRVNPPGPAGVYRVFSPALPGLTYAKANIPVGSNGGASVTLADVAAAGAFVPGTGIDIAKYSTLIDPARKVSGSFKVNYDYAAWLQFYVDARYSKTENFTTDTPQSIFTTLPAGYPGNPFGASVSLQKYFLDLAPAQQTSYFENDGASFGATGAFLKGWDYDASVAWSRNVVSDHYTRAPIDSSLLSAAINDPDPTKHPILAYDSSTVKDPNPAGLLDSLRRDLPHRDTSDVIVYSLRFNGPVWSLPTGDISLAAGAEAQLEQVKFYRAPWDVPFTLKAPFKRWTNSYYAETQVPLLSEKQHVPLVHLLQAGAAIRYDKFSDTHHSAVTPSYTGLFQPFHWFTVRGSHSEGFKEVRLYDLRAPVSNFVTTYSATRRVTHDPLRNGELVVGSIPNISGGNPYLKPETSTSKSYGVVVDLPWIKGLSFSVDTFDIQYKDKSGSTTLQTLLDFFPERVTRGPSLGDGLPGQVASYDGSNINLTAVRTKGTDFTVRYDFTTSWGGFATSGSWSSPGVVITKATPASADSLSYLPKRGSGQFFWTRGPWTAGVTIDYQGRWTSTTNPSATTFYTSKVIQWNPQLAYDFGKDSSYSKSAVGWWARALVQTKVSLTLINAFKDEPTLADAGNGFYSHDPRLQRYIITVVKKF